MTPVRPKDSIGVRQLFITPVLLYHVPMHPNIWILNGYRESQTKFAYNYLKSLY
jgi:hypothetical protein